LSIASKFISAFKKSIPNTSNRYFMSGGNIPPEMNTEGYLRAYSQIGWWHAVVFRIALGCSEVKWTLHDVSNRNKPKQIFEHPILKLLHLVNPFQTSNEFVALDTIYEESSGEAFWALNFNALGEPAEIILPYPHLMSVVPAREFPFVKGYVYGTGANAIPFDTNEIIHIKYPNPLNQYRGLGQAEAIGVNLSAQQNADRWVNQFFYNSARPDGVISFDYNLSDEQFNKLKKEWSEKYKGVSKAHQVALLEGGGKYLQIQNTVKDMDFPNLQLKNRDIILGIVGMPLSVMGISENVNLANAAAGDYTFARWIVKPRLDWKCAKLQEQLIPKFRNSEKLKLGFEEVVKETVEQKINSAESGMRAGYLTINEARSMQGYDPLPNGDVLLVPLNLIPTPVSGNLRSQIDTSSEPLPPPKSEYFDGWLHPKGLTPDQKKTHWERYAQKTERQETMFKRVFESVFDDQKKFIVEQYEKTGTLPNDLIDENTAKKFEPAIELVYESAFTEAI
jgi:HK97 family phage portal protein